MDRPCFVHVSSMVYTRPANGNNWDEDGAMGNGCEPKGTFQKLGDIGKSTDGTDCDGAEKEKVGTVRPRDKKT